MQRKRAHPLIKKCVAMGMKPFLLNFRMWFKYGQKTQKLQKQHALKGQKLLAQGNALGIIAVSKAPCKGKSFVNCLVF